MDILKQLREAVGGHKIMEPVQRLNQVIQTIDALRSLLKDSKVSQSVKDRIQGLVTLTTTRPNLTGINHYFNHFLLRMDPENQPPVLRELLEVYHERWKNVERKTARVAYELIDFSEETVVLVHGAEVSVTALFDILKVERAQVRVYQTVGRPGMSGRKQAEAIAEAGFSVTLIDDHTIGEILPDCDLVLTGCEVVLHNDLIHIAGTHSLLAAAHYYHRPVFVLGDSRRIMNAKFFPQNVLQTLIGEGKARPDLVWKGAPDSIEVYSPEKEQIPNYLIARFVFEDGSYAPEELKAQIDKVMVTKFF